MSWMEKHADFVREQYARGTPTKEIAAAIGVSKAAVCGFAHRSGLSLARVVFWNEERRLRLRKLWEANETQPNIANLLGTSRETVRKEAARLGLGRRGSNERAAVERVARKAGLNAGKSKQNRSAPSFTERAPVNGHSAPLHINLLELTGSTCKFPFGVAAPFTFCGHATAVGPYCTLHARLCYAPPAARKPRENSTFNRGKSYARQDAEERA